MLKNSRIAELLALEVDASSGHVQKALRRASRLAFLWPIEAVDLYRQTRSLTQLSGVGPHLERLIRAWIEDPPDLPEPHPLRRNFLSLTEARELLSANPEWTRLLRGDLQMHTQYSDGAGTVQQMAEQGMSRGYEFIAITDHSKGLTIANGMDEKRLCRQGKEIDRVNRSLRKSGTRLQVLKSIEMNLNPRGEGDMDRHALGGLDLVLGSFHSALRTKEDQTGRYIAGLRNPDIHVLGHPRGRVYNYRAGLNADWPRVFAEAAALDKAVEIDSYVDRQDLSIDLLAMARESSVRISIGTDAHSPDQMSFIELGLATALLAKISREHILNFLSCDQVLGWSASLKSRARMRSSLPLPRAALSSGKGVSRAKRELIDTGKGKRFVRRGKAGKFKESDDVGKSLAGDRRRKAKTAAKSGQGDKGDRKPAAKRATKKKK